MEDEKPPPALISIDEIYEDFGLVDNTPEHAPYIDETTANYERRINELNRQVEALDEEVEKLDAENKELRNSVTNSGESMDKGDNESTSSGGDSLGNFEATFYTAFCPTGCIGITATGVDVSNTIYHEGKRIIAVDPTVIPLGTHVKVTLENGDSFEATAQDTGGDIKGGRIDVLVGSRDEARSLGRQTAKVEAIE